MKNFLFINSHLGSDEEKFIEILNSNPRIDILRRSLTYSSPLVAIQASAYSHKLNSTQAIYGDHLLFNHVFSCDALYNTCKFIYLVRPPRHSLPLMLTEYNSFEHAVNYYCFRLRRLAEMAKFTPTSVLLTWDDLSGGRGMDLVQKYLGLIQPIEIPTNSFPFQSSQNVPAPLLDRAEEAYERYLYCLRSRLVSTRPI